MTNESIESDQLKFLMKLGSGYGNLKQIFDDVYLPLVKLALPFLVVSAIRKFKREFNVRKKELHLTLGISRKELKDIFKRKSNEAICCKVIDNLPNAITFNMLKFYTTRNNTVYDAEQVNKAIKKKANYG